MPVISETEIKEKNLTGYMGDMGHFLFDYVYLR